MKKFLLSILLLVIGFVNAYATHNRGGDITYKYTGDATHPYKYHIIVKTYTKWTSPASTDRCELVVYIDGDSILAPRTNGPSINCSFPAHDGVLVGCSIRYNTYELDYEFPATGNYNIYINDANRIGGICNIPSSDLTSFYIDAELVISPFFGGNNSPIYNAIPIISDTIGSVQYHNPMVTETDGDSLYYQLIPPLSFGGTPSPGYTDPTSSTSFTINPNTCVITWNTPTMLCLYDFATKITEYRKVGGTYFLIGYTMQEGWNEPGCFGAGISENSAETISVNVFPNPTTDVVNFSISADGENKTYSVHIINSLGQDVKDFSLNKTVTITGLKPGIYFYSINSSEKTVKQGKFIVLGASVK